jgi:aerobic-type carbon monoxide dehydrogenase small subunit (CoxS/CutS family)
MPERVSVALTVNGAAHILELEPRRTLLETLREDLHLTGAKPGCDMGTCGACTALVNDTPIYSCITLAVTCDGAAITTIEGLGVGDALDAVQLAFIEHDALQCGFCTPGQVLSMKALVAVAPATLNDEAIARGMAGNLCRCGAYAKIRTVGRALAQSGGSPA